MGTEVAFNNIPFGLPTEVLALPFNFHQATNPFVMSVVPAVPVELTYVAYLIV